MHTVDHLTLVAQVGGGDDDQSPACGLQLFAPFAIALALPRVALVVPAVDSTSTFQCS
jgi:hypothetical protein